VKKKGGGKVCLKPGTYVFEKSLQIVFNDYLTVTGHGKVTLMYTGSEPQAILIADSLEVIVEGVTLIRNAMLPNGKQDACGIIVRDTFLDVTIRDCLIWMPVMVTQYLSAGGVGVAVDGSVYNLIVTDCVMVCGVGIGMPSGSALPIPKPRPLILVRADICDNILVCGASGVMLHALGLSVTVRRNWILSGLPGDGVWLDGTTEPCRSNLVDGNWIIAARIGIAANADQTTISNNVVRGTFDLAKAKETFVDPTCSGIALYTETYADSLEECQIIGNRCSRLMGMGIQIAGRVTGLMIKQNFISDTAGGGIVMTDGANSSQVTIENNSLRNVALCGLSVKSNQARFFKDYVRGSAAIEVARYSDSDVGTNAIEGVGLKPEKGRPQLECAGILVLAPRTARIHDNRLDDVYPSASIPTFQTDNESAGIDITSPIGVIEVVNNIVRTGLKSDDGSVSTSMHAYALRIGPAYSPNVFTFNYFALQTTTAASAAPAVERRAAATAAFPAGTATTPRFDEPVSVGWMYLNISNPWFQIARPGSAMIIRANQFRTVDQFTPGVLSPFAMVKIFDANVGCTFGGNVCIAEPRFFIKGVQITTPTVIADSNQILGTSYGSLEIDTGQTEEWTVLGNIVQGTIMINSTDLRTTPVASFDLWKKLNRMG
jgi:hypothetical protein